MEECSLTKEIKTETSIEEHFENEKIIDEDGIKKELLLDEEPVGGKGLSSLESELPDEECIKTEIEEIEEKPSYDQLKSEIEDTVDRAIAGPSGCDKKDISAHCSVKDESDYEMNEELEIKNDSDSDDSSLEHNFSDDEEDSMQSEEGMQTRADTMEIEECSIPQDKARSKDEGLKSNSAKKIDVQNVHKAEETHKCKYCDFATRFSVKLNEHLLKIHNKKVFECDLCDYSSNKKKCFENHMKAVHSNRKMYKCSLCDYRTRRQSYVQIHTDGKHLEKKRYECNICNFSTAWKSSFENHITSKHAGNFAEKTEFRCSFCNFCSTSNTGLRTHLLSVHIKSKEIKCPYCDHCVATSNQLKVHIDFTHWDKKKYSHSSKGSENHPSTTYKVLIPSKTYQKKE